MFEVGEIIRTELTAVEVKNFRQEVGGVMAREGKPESASDQYAVAMKKGKTLYSIYSKLLCVCCYLL